MRRRLRRRHHQRTEIGCGRGVRRVDAGRGLPLQIRHRRLRLGLGLRCVVDDLALVRGDAVDRVEHQRWEVHGDAPQHRTHSLPADFSSLVVVGRGTRVEHASADELHRVGEVGQRQQTTDGALRGVVDVVEVREAVGRDVQDLLDVVAVLGQDGREVRQLVDLVDQGIVAVIEEAANIAEGLIQGAERVVQIRRAVGEHLRHRRDVVGELHDLLVAVGQRVDEHLQILHGAEQVCPRVAKPARGLRQLAKRLAERVAVSVEGVGGLVHEIAQRALQRSLLGPEFAAQRRQLLLDLIPFDRHGGAVKPDARAVCQCRAAGVRRRQLNEPGRHQVRRDDERLGVVGDLHIVVEGHGDLDIACSRFDRVDRSDGHADDADIVTGIQADRRGEVGDDLVSGPRRPHKVCADGQHRDERGGQRNPQPAGAVGGRVRVGHGDFGLMMSRSEI